MPWRALILKKPCRPPHAAAASAGQGVRVVLADRAHRASTADRHRAPPARTEMDMVPEAKGGHQAAVLADLRVGLVPHLSL